MVRRINLPTRFTNLPTLHVEFLKPARMRFDTKGGGIDGGRNGAGEAISIEMSGGGILVGSYEECFIHYREEHEYVNWLAARLNGSFRFINVPILSDWMGPFPVDGQNVPQAFVSGIAHSDGALFSDAAGYSQATVFGTMMESAALNGGILKLRLQGAARKLRWSDWFSIYHEAKGWRTYRYWDVLSTTGDDVADVTYSLAITPPLREAVASTVRVEFARPRCVMKFPTGFTAPWEVEGFMRSHPTFQFAEAF